MIGIITAITEEFNALKDLINVSSEEIFASMPYIKGKIAGTDTVLVQCGQGKVNAACAAQILIDRFGADSIINIGIGGALSDILHIGDIVISEDTVQYDMDGRGEGFPLGQIPDLDTLAFSADKKLIGIAVDAAEKNNVNYHTGRVLTADLFLSDKNKKEEIVKAFGGLVCEMEGAAIAQVCYLNHIPFLIIRAVSDTAEEYAADMVLENLNRAMSQTVGITREILENVNE